MKLYMFRTAFEQDQDRTSWSCSKAVHKPVWHVPLLSVQWINSRWWTDELSETCRVSWQNKFVKLVYLVGFITKKLYKTIRLVDMSVSLFTFRFNMYLTLFTYPKVCRFYSQQTNTVLIALWIILTSECVFYFVRYTEWAKSRYTVHSTLYTIYCIPTFGPLCTLDIV